MDRKKLKSGRKTHRKLNVNEENEYGQTSCMLARMPFVRCKEKWMGRDLSNLQKM